LVDVGLCICFYDFIEVGDPYIYPAEGSAHQKVKFRLGMSSQMLKNYLLNIFVVVFRPFIGEIIAGRICSCREDGIKGVSLTMLTILV
jgi:DNA-directed RNA polymerase III subunit RPC8